MKLNETDLTKIRIPLAILDATDGHLVTGYVPGAHVLQTSKSGSAWADAAGMLVEIGSGAYYYQGVVGDVTVEGFLAAFLNDVAVNAMAWRPVVGAAGLTIFPFSIFNGGALAPGCNPNGAGELKMSLDGAAFVDATGTFGEMGGGYYYYRHNAANVDTPVLVKVSKAGFDEALAWGTAGTNGVTSPPAIASIAPIGNAQPGAAGAFSAAFSTARTTPLTFQLTGIPTGCQISITMKFANREEKLTALDFTGAWCWPFDVTGPGDNSIGSLAVEPVHVQLLPRGGWPPGEFVFEVAAAAKATPP